MIAFAVSNQRVLGVPEPSLGNKRPLIFFFVRQPREREGTKIVDLCKVEPAETAIALFLHLIGVNFGFRLHPQCARDGTLFAFGPLTEIEAANRSLFRGKGLGLRNPLAG